MLDVKPEAKPLVNLIIEHSRKGDVDPEAIALALPKYSAHHVALVIEQLAQLPYPDLTQLIRNN
ncbi:hypothetical protein QF117_12205 [Vibrio sp. YMD68]|uniref:hypothetical protein n=1 Tax=Vibrio sp. YMD68 TaxID=3042300 RepID=UPI00249BC87C|nr:hypothetical protein [Vibrio sp. YMD68]WGW01540.1 hypothetical protein QF117_12205 [Vibrio sp. YMD68]